MDYPIEIAERVPYLWLQEDPAAVQAGAGPSAAGQPARHAGRQGPAGRTRRSAYFGTRYSYVEDSGAAYAALAKPAGGGSAQPAAAQRLHPATDRGAADRAGAPDRRADAEPVLRAGHGFPAPAGGPGARSGCRATAASLRSATLLRFYEACVSESLNEAHLRGRRSRPAFRVRAPRWKACSSASTATTHRPARLLDEVVGRPARLRRCRPSASPR